jgi:UDP-N-acetylmuramate dehydrogenase
VGSFFLNPIVEADVAEALFADAARTGIVERAADVPRWPMPDGRIKLAAGWLVERAGVAKGERHGPVGVSERHALCLVHRGGGTSAQLCALARNVRARVRTRFGIDLVAEPTFVGFEADPLA